MSSVLAQQAEDDAENWVMATVANPVTQQEQCMLKSAVVTISDGYDTTPVTLLINNDGLIVVTESIIDDSFKDLTLVVDENEAIKTQRVVNEKIVVFEQNVEGIIEQFIKGYDATVYLRFWPTFPATQSFPAQFSLRGFTKAYENLADCSSPAQ
ncbi:MAG: hypothetical protein V2J55_20245 [Candidatus Competibacteraceae bacterium]|nr:hypothetical protein [Candidatus Competibacteraceae bacterium]